jgi:hypothetical protein
MSTDHAKPTGGSDEYAEMKKMGGRKGNKRAQNHDGGSSLMQMGGSDECYQIIKDADGNPKMLGNKVVLNNNVQTMKVQKEGSDEMVCPEGYAEASDSTTFEASTGGRRRRRKSKKARKVSRKSRKSRRGRKSRKN